MNPMQLEKSLKTLSKNKWCVNIISSPSLSKSAVVHKVAKDLEYYLIDFRLAQADPSDLVGLPSFTSDGTRCTFASPDTFILSTDALPVNREKVAEITNSTLESVNAYKDADLISKLQAANIEVPRYKGVLLFFDELSQAPMALKNAAFKIILDKKVGNHLLHPKTFIVAAGNKITDKAGVQPSNTALQSRMVNLELEPDLNSWLKWAGNAGIDGSVQMYLKYRPENLYQFDPEKANGQLNYPCYRTWEMTSDYIHTLRDSGTTLEKEAEAFEILQGCLGQGVATEFKSFSELKIPSPKDIMDNPTTLVIPESLSNQYAFSGLLLNIAEGVFKSTANTPMYGEIPIKVKSWATVVDRLPAEYKMLIVKTIYSRNIDSNDTEAQEELSEYLIDICSGLDDAIFD